LNRLSPSGRSEVIRRVLDGQSVRQTAKVMGVPLSTVYYHARNHCRKQSLFQLSPLSVKEQGYLVGLFLGDGSLIRHRKRGEYLVKVAFDERRDQDLILFAESLLMNAGKKVTITHERGMSILRVWSKSLFRFAYEYLGINRRLDSHHHEKLLIRPECWKDEFFFGFIGGLIDSDGYIRRNLIGHGGATVTTASAVLKSQIQWILAAHSISTTCSVTRESNFKFSPRFMITIPAEEMRGLCSEILSVKHMRFHGGPGRN
jgi:hypothetical protein